MASTMEPDHSPQNYGSIPKRPLVSSLEVDPEINTVDAIDDHPKHCVPSTRDVDFDAIVVGAGWAGIWILHRLRQRGFRVKLLEAHEDVGGVWLYTNYPGCRNETETPVYQFSAPETWQNWDWSERYPTQADMHQYMRHVTDVLQLRDDMQFNTRVDKAVWDESKSHWIISSGSKKPITATYFIAATGYAGKKYVPDIPGLDHFPQAYHTSDWPADLDVAGKRVVVIGTGSSGMQTIETIGPIVSHLTVFQRNPNLANPRRQEDLTHAASAAERINYPDRYDTMKRSPTGLEVHPIDRDTFTDDRVTRLGVYESLWQKGAQNFWFGNYRDLLTNRAANQEAYSFWRAKVAPRVSSPAKRKLLCPDKAPHAFGAKRPSLEESYFEVFNQENVDLIDLKTDRIVEVTNEGIKMASGETHEVDVICIATGYDFAIGSQVAIPIYGRVDQLLKDKWLGKDAAGTTTHLGLMTHGFPNLLFPAGPQAPTAFGITPRLAELQGDWIADMLVKVRDEYKGSVIESSHEAEVEWTTRCNEAVAKTLIAETDGWYMGNNIPGRKKQTLFWFGGLPQYMEICEEVAKNGYKGFGIH